MVTHAHRDGDAGVRLLRLAEEKAHLWDLQETFHCDDISAEPWGKFVEAKCARPENPKKKFLFVINFETQDDAVYFAEKWGAPFTAEEASEEAQSSERVDHSGDEVKDSHSTAEPDSSVESSTAGLDDSNEDKAGEEKEDNSDGDDDDDDNDDVVPPEETPGGGTDSGGGDEDEVSWGLHLPYTVYGCLLLVSRIWVSRNGNRGRNSRGGCAFDSSMRFLYTSMRALPVESITSRYQE